MQGPCNRARAQRKSSAGEHCGKARRKGSAKILAEELSHRTQPKGSTIEPSAIAQRVNGRRGTNTQLQKAFCFCSFFTCAEKTRCFADRATKKAPDCEFHEWSGPTTRLRPYQVSECRELLVGRALLQTTWRRKSRGKLKTNSGQKWMSRDGDRRKRLRWPGDWYIQMPGLRACVRRPGKMSR